MFPAPDTDLRRCLKDVLDSLFGVLVSFVQSLDLAGFGLNKGLLDLFLGMILITTTNKNIMLVCFLVATHVHRSRGAQRTIFWLILISLSFNNWARATSSTPSAAVSSVDPDFRFSASTTFLAFLEVVSPTLA